MATWTHGELRFMKMRTKNPHKKLGFVNWLYAYILHMCTYNHILYIYTIIVQLSDVLLYISCMIYILFLLMCKPSSMENTHLILLGVVVLSKIFSGQK